jgi:hypothetical protein
MKLALTTMLVLGVVGALALGNLLRAEPAPKPKTQIDWYFANTETIPGQPMGLVCDRYVSRPEIRKVSSNKLLEGDQIKTICTVSAATPLAG